MSTIQHYEHEPLDLEIWSCVLRSGNKQKKGDTSKI